MKTFSNQQISRALKSALTGLAIFLLLWGYHSATYIPLPVEDGEILLHSNQIRDDLRSTYSQAIRSADRSILLMIYSLREKSLINLLKKRAEEGVAVTVICDPDASKGLKRRLGKKIKTHYRYSKGIMHLKVLVVDEASVWLGSANLTHSSLKIHGNLVMSLQSESLAEKMLVQAEEMVSSEKSSAATPFKLQVGEQHLELWLLPEQAALYCLIELIDSAKEQIKIAMFTWTHPKLAEAVVQAHRRGIDVEVVMDYQSSQGASAQIFEELYKENVPVVLSHGEGLLHHKMLLIDGHTLVNGSANWTRSAFSYNDDCFIVLSPLTQKQGEQIKRLWRVISTETLEPLAKFKLN